MSWYSIFYWFAVADNISEATGFVSIFCIILFVITMMIVLSVDWDTRDEEDMIKLKMLKKVRNWSFILVFVAGLIWMFVPSKKDMLMIIAGGSVGTFISKDSSIQALPADVTKYLHLSMKKELEELTSDSKEENTNK